MGRLSALVRGVQMARGHDRLVLVNRSINHMISFRPDSSSWGVTDRWSGAAETLGRSSGDCEDFAITKMQTLAAAGISPKDLYLVVGKDLTRRSDHAVLVVRDGGKFWVLDNGSDEVIADEMYRDFRPVMTLNANGRWLHGYTVGADPALASARSTDVGLRPAAGTYLAAVAQTETRGLGSLRAQ